MNMLRAKLFSMAQEEQAAKIASARKFQARGRCTREACGTRSGWGRCARAKRRGCRALMSPAASHAVRCLPGRNGLALREDPHVQLQGQPLHRPPALE